jgi:hypothetical protein
MTDKWQVDPKAMEILRNGNPPTVDWGKFRRAGETLAVALTRDEIVEANFDIIAYIRDEIRRQIGDRPYRISATYDNVMDFNEDNVIFHIDVLTPIEGD